MRQTAASPATAQPVVVIGAGPVGLYAAFQLGLRGFRPTLLDALPQIGGQCAALYGDREIYDAPGFPAIAAHEFALRLGDQLAPFDPLYLLGRRAMSVWGGLETGFNIETDTGETITGAGVVYAGGAGALQPRRIAAEGIETLAPGSLGFATETAPETGRIAVVGSGPTAVEAALSLASASEATTLIHSGPIGAAPDRLDALHAEARRKRLTLVEGEIARVSSADGKLRSVEVRGQGGETRHDLDYLLVQAGLELVQGGLTGLEPVADPATGETATRGVFVVGDALVGPAASASGRPPVIAAGLSEAIRTAEALAARLSPGAPKALPHTASSPTLRARLRVA